MATSIEREDAGYQKSLKPRQIQMIAIGGAIGSGLFLGAGQELKDAGPIGLPDRAESVRSEPSPHGR